MNTAFYFALLSRQLSFLNSEFLKIAACKEIFQGDFLAKTNLSLLSIEPVSLV